jgi:peroxiredoxin
MTVKKGELVDNFSLVDQYEDEFELNDLKGMKVLLSFHPLAWTSVCTKQMKALDRNHKVFTDNNTLPLGISVDPVPSKKAWAEEMGLENLKILSDFWPHGELAKKLDLFIEKYGFSGRVNILLNKENEVIWAKEYELTELPDIDEVISVVESM